MSYISGQFLDILLAFGLDLPLLGFTNNQNKLVVINENEQHSIQKLFNIGENQRVKQFLLQGKFDFLYFYPFFSIAVRVLFRQNFFYCFPIPIAVKKIIIFQLIK